MFTTLEALLTFHGADSKAIVWAHNSHIGDAGATEMSARGEHNIGHLCRKEFGEQAYLYRPESELASQYFQAVLPQQFDEYIWFDDARAVTPFDTAEIEGLPDTCPVGV
jgi:erythromycin esterase-like protein